jgi:hypothetical protein
VLTRCVFQETCSDMTHMLCRHAAELNMQTVPSLNITYTEEKVRAHLDALPAADRCPCFRCCRAKPTCVT